ncbi:MAG TPA: hypothetical protein VE987_04645, partial [Polyangiaceae bacterium]|nr:hypothetical protein [Polyangiaceae bacterium]
MTHPRAHAAIGLVALVAACGAAQGGFGSVGAPGGGDGGAQSSGGSSGTSASSGGGSSGASSGGSSSSTAGASSSSGGSTSSSGSPPPPGPPGCGLAQAAFCDTFDTPSPGGRAGDLDDASWSASRISTINNFGQGQYNVWGSTTTSACGKQTSGVLPPNDMFF